MSLCNQFNRIGLDRENSSVDGWDAISCCTTSLCELLCDYFNAFKALLLLNTVLISTTLIKDWFIQHWLTVLCRDFHFPSWLYISNLEYQWWDLCWGWLTVGNDYIYSWLTVCAAALAIFWSDDYTHELGLAVRIPERPVMAALCICWRGKKSH